MSLDTFMKGVLDAMTPIVTPDWGKLVGLIPALLTLVVLAYVVITAQRWVHLLRVAPAASHPAATLQRPRIAGRIPGGATPAAEREALAASTAPAEAAAVESQRLEGASATSASTTPRAAKAAPGVKARADELRRRWFRRG